VAKAEIALIGSCHIHGLVKPRRSRSRKAASAFRVSSGDERLAARKNRYLSKEARGSQRALNPGKRPRGFVIQLGEGTTSRNEYFSVGQKCHASG
jgi:hypothetical protein